MSIVGSVRLDRVWESKARVNFVALTGESAPKELEACVRGLERHVEKTVPEANRLQCDVCGGWSDEGLKSCPYCADEGPPAEELFPAIATRRRKVSSGTATNEGSRGGEDMARIRQDGTVVEKPKLEPCPIIHVEKISTPDPNPGLERLASQVGAILSAPVSRETLEAAFRLADDCDRVGGICTWSAGVLMHDIHERLWQQGVKGKGNFDAVVRQHTRFSPSYARRLMRLAKVTREDVERYGASKVMTIIAAPQDEWPKLFAEAGEMSVRELEQAVSQIKQAKHEAAVEAAAARNEETPKKRGRPKGSKSQKRREEGQAAALQVAEEALAKQPTTITVGARTDKTYRIDLESGEGRAELANDVRAVLRMIAPNAFELRFERIEDDADE